MKRTKKIFDLEAKELNFKIKKIYKYLWKFILKNLQKNFVGISKKQKLFKIMREISIENLNIFLKTWYDPQTLHPCNNLWLTPKQCVNV